MRPVLVASVTLLAACGGVPPEEASYERCQQEYGARTGNSSPAYVVISHDNPGASIAGTVIGSALAAGVVANQHKDCLENAAINAGKSGRNVPVINTTGAVTNPAVRAQQPARSPAIPVGPDKQCRKTMTGGAGYACVSD